MPAIPMEARLMAHARHQAIGRTHRMHMALRTRSWTRADFERLPDDGNKYEVIDGALLVSPRAAIGARCSRERPLAATIEMRRRG